MSKDKSKTEKHPGGRPSKYKPEYCQELIDFFSREPNRKEVMEVSTSNGVNSKGGTNDFRKEKYVLVPNDPPFFEDFATSIGVSDDTIVNWAKKYPEFLAAYNKAKFLQKRFLIINGLAGCYPPASYIFTAKNITDMRDKQEVEHSGSTELKIDENQFKQLIHHAAKRVNSG
jgi:hypothetical protein